MKSCLWKIKIGHFRHLDSEDRVRMEYLMEEFSAPCPIRPADMFDMNLATMISLSPVS